MTDALALLDELLALLDAEDATFDPAAAAQASADLLHSWPTDDDSDFGLAVIELASQVGALAAFEPTLERRRLMRSAHRRVLELS
jgi:hypothetical protein